MKKQFLVISAILIGSLLFVFCNKTSNVFHVIDQQFIPLNEADATSRVKTFLNAVEAKKNNERTSFPNMEVNEGFWTFSGSSNYEKNVNLWMAKDTNSEFYYIFIDNVVENGVIKMSGESALEQYVALSSIIQAEELERNALATLMCFKLLSADNLKTHIEVNVFYSAAMVTPCPQPGFTNFSSVRHNLDDGIYDALVSRSLQNGCIPWAANYSIIDFASTVTCSQDNLFCFHTATSNDPASINPFMYPFICDYDILWLHEDVTTALYIADEYLASVNWNNGTNFAPLHLVGMFLALKTTDSSPVFSKQYGVLRLFVTPESLYCY